MRAGLESDALPPRDLIVTKDCTGSRSDSSRSVEIAVCDPQRPVVQRFKLPALKHSFPGAPAQHSLVMVRDCRIQKWQRISDRDNPGALKVIARIATNKFRATYIVDGNSTPGLSLACGIFCYRCRFLSGWLQIRSVRRTRGKNCRYGDSTNS